MGEPVRIAVIGRLTIFERKRGIAFFYNILDCGTVLHVDGFRFGCPSLFVGCCVV